MTRDHAMDPRGAECLPKRERERPPAMCMDNIGGAQSPRGDRESGRLSSLRENAGRRASDGLPVPVRAQPPRQREQGLLPAAPGLFGVYVNNREWSQKNDFSTFQASSALSWLY